MQFELREIQKRLGITSIIVTHDQEEALTMSDRVAVMAEGQIVQIGTPIDVYERPATQFVSEFLGTANIFLGTVGSDKGPGTWEVQLQSGPASAVVSTLHQLRKGQPVKIAVRPERLKIGAADTGLKAKAQDVVFRGSYWAYELHVSGRDEPVFVYANAREELPEDGIVGLTWPSEYAIVLEDGAAS
jgi:ABC-type Fe3+/spermidine/putrescine transport system ATPase subunit